MANTDEINVTESWRHWVTSDGVRRTEASARLQGGFVLSGLSLDKLPIRTSYLHLERELWRLGGGRIRSAVQPERVGRNESVILVAPHLGYSKLMKESFGQGLGSSRLSILRCIPNEEPWLWRHAAAFHVAERIPGSRTFVPVEMAYGNRVLLLQRQYGAATIEISRGGGLGVIDTFLKRVDEPVALSIFPEGGTTGKRSTNGRTIHSLEPFHSGFATLAARLSWPILGVAYIVDRSAESHIVVVGPYRLAGDIDADGSAAQVRFDMQAAMLDLLRTLD